MRHHSPTVVGTSACIWCGEPVILYKGFPYTRYCNRQKTGNYCKHQNRFTVKAYRDRLKYGRFMSTVKRRRKLYLAAILTELKAGRSIPDQKRMREVCRELRT